MKRVGLFLSLIGAGMIVFAVAGANAQDGPSKAEHFVEVTTNDGKTVTGRYRDQGDSVVLDTDDGPVEIPKVDIKSVKQGAEVPAAPAPAEPAKAPADDPPADDPPADDPPADDPPADDPPADDPPADDPPADDPPADDPPADDPPADTPPADDPPADDPPADDPPADDPPADDPPADDPPADDPPTDDPPADDPPADDPPADDPPADDPPADDPPADDPPADMPPADDPPADDPPPADEPPADEPPADEPPADTPPPSDAPPSDTPPSDVPPSDTPPTDAPPADATDSAPVDRTEIATTSYYPAEEAEFGPIDVDYRGPVELSLYGGWTMYSSELGTEKGGSFLGGARVSINFGEDDRIGLDLTWGITRVRFHNVDNEIRNGTFGRKDVRGEVTVNSFVVSLTYRMTYLRLEYLTPFVRFGLGANYFDDENGGGTFRPNNAGTVQPLTDHIDDEIGFMAQLGFGFDYKLARNWSLRWEWSGDLMINDWNDRDSPQFAGNMQFGIVWHFQ